MAERKSRIHDKARVSSGIKGDKVVDDEAPWFHSHHGKIFVGKDWIRERRERDIGTQGNGNNEFDNPQRSFLAG